MCKLINFNTKIDNITLKDKNIPVNLCTIELIVFHCDLYIKIEGDSSLYMNN